MSMSRFRVLASTLLIALAVAASPAQAKRVDGVFTAVKDANVVVLDYGEGSYDVRLYGTEAPADGQPFAAEAKAFVREALLGKHGAMRFKYKNAKEEMVARIFYFDADGHERDLGVDLAAAGLAWLRPGARYRPVVEGQVDQLTAAQADAQSARRGVWSTDKPIAPWTFRGESLPAEGEFNGLLQGVEGTLDVNISKRSGSDNECAIAKNPSNSLQLVAHCNSLSTPWRSTDGGQTWTVGGSIGSYCCDPNLAWDKFGNLYATFINGGTNAIVTMLSVDAGLTYAPLGSFSGSIDQPSVVATELPGGNVALWIVWNQSSAMVARGALVTGLGSANIGAFNTLQSIATGPSCSFGDLAVSPNGAVVQVCGPQTGQTGGNIVINTDADGFGAGGFGAAVTAATTLVGGFDFIPAQPNRSVDTESGLAYDRNPASPHFGRLYLIYTDELIQESSDMNIMLRFSDDDGATWSAAQQVNTDSTTRSQFLPKISSDPATGNVAICWHDTRDSAPNTAMEIWCDSFTPAGFPSLTGNVQVSDGASISTDGAMDFGDYNGLSLAGGTAHPVWADSSNSTGDNPNTTTALDTYTDTYSVLTSDYTLSVTPPTLSVCAPANAVFTVNIGNFGGFIDPVDLSVSGNPGTTTANFSLDPVTPPNTSTLTIGNTSGGTAGTSTIVVSTSSTTGPKTVQVTLNLALAAPPPASLTSPANGEIGVLTQPTLSWTAIAGVTSYFVEVSDDPTFTTVDYSATVSGSSHQVTATLTPSTLYNWRITATNSCASTPSGAFTFTTANILTACSGPVTLNDSAVASPYPSVATVSSGAGSIVGIDLSFSGFTHTFPDDLDMLLVSPSGQKMIFMSDVGGSGDVSGLSFSLADGAATIVPDSGPLAAGSFRPSDAEASGTFPAPAPAGPYSSAAPTGAATFLGTFGAATLPGGWQLFIFDDAGQDVGTLTQWCVNITLSGSMPFIDGFESGNSSAWSNTVP